MTTYTGPHFPTGVRISFQGFVLIKLCSADRMTTGLITLTVIKTVGQCLSASTQEQEWQNQPFYQLLILQDSWRLSVLSAHFTDEEAEM